MAISIAYYISGHGFGHAARQTPVIHRLVDQGVRVHVRTAAPPKFFDRPGITYTANQYDIGMVQADALTLDPAATFRWYADFLTQQADLIASEAAFLREQAISLVVADMPPVAVEIAAAASLNSVVVTHFTWDWVYNHYISDYPEYQYVIDSITASYNKANLLLEMPFAHAMPQFSRIEHVPLVITPRTRSTAEIRRLFDVPDDHRLAVISMGGMDYASDLQPLRDKRGWTFIVTPAVWPQVMNWPHMRRVDASFANFQDLFASADVLIGKLGYSTLCEVIGHRTPMLIVERPQWAEQALLTDALLRWGHGHQISLKAYERGDWVDLIDELAVCPDDWPQLPTNGVEVIAARLLSLASV